MRALLKFSRSQKEDRSRQLISSKVCKTCARARAELCVDVASGLISTTFYLFVLFIVLIHIAFFFLFQIYKGTT